MRRRWLGPCAEQLKERDERGELRFFDDHVKSGRVASGLGDVVGGIDAIRDHLGGDEVRLVLGVGLPRTKVKLVARLEALGLRWATVVHPSAVVGPNVRWGEGTYVAAGAIITVNVEIGRFVTVNIHCQVAHDDVVRDFVTLHPDCHLSGNATIGTGCELGTGSIVLPGTVIGEWAIIGAGGVAVRSLPGGDTYVGLPAKPFARDSGPHQRA